MSDRIERMKFIIDSKVVDGKVERVVLVHLALGEGDSDAVRAAIEALVAHCEERGYQLVGEYYT